MDGTAELQRLGWEWLPNGVAPGTGPGVMIRVQLSSRKLNVFVPLTRVWLTFDNEMQRVGCPSAAAVGAPFSVGGFFSFIKKAAKSIGSAAKRLVPKAVQRAAAKVASVAKKYGGAALKYGRMVASNPWIRRGLMAASVAVPMLAPVAGAVELANRASDAYNKGIAAARQIRAGVQTAENMARVARGLNARNFVTGVVQLAQQGDSRARQVAGALQGLR